MKARITLLSISLAATACKTVKPASDDSVPLIVGGHELEPDNPGRTSAVVITFDGEFRCSGVLVAEKLVLTAAHCLQNQPAAGFRVSFDDVLREDSTNTRKVARVAQFRPWSRRSGAHYDIGWLELEGAAPAPYEPVPVLMDPRRLNRGDRLVQVGYGRTSSVTHDYGHRYTVDTTFNRHEHGRLWRHVFVTGPTPGRGTCEGDSGGPSYVQVDGVWHLAGLLFGAPPEMFENARCENGQDVQTFAGSFKSWIESTAGVRVAPEGASPRMPNYVPRGGAYTHGFETWCAKAEELAPDAWYTVVLLMNAVRATECVAAASALADLESLSLADAAVTDIGPLVGLRSIERLDLRFNGIEDLAPLVRLTSLETLLAHGNRIESLAPLAHLTELTSLQVSCNRVASLAPLARLVKLTTLKASVNQVRDVAVLTALPKLDLIELFRNPVAPDAPAVHTLRSGSALLLLGDQAPYADCADPGWTSADPTF